MKDWIGSDDVLSIINVVAAHFDPYLFWSFTFLLAIYAAFGIQRLLVEGSELR